MKVTLELDQDVENLIRYIPNSELNGVLVQLIREAITLRMSLTEKPTPNMNKIKEKVESCGLKVVVDVAAKAELPLCCGNLVQDYKSKR